MCLDRQAETEIERLRQDWTGLDLILTDASYTAYPLPGEIGLSVWVSVPLWVRDSLLKDGKWSVQCLPSQFFTYDKISHPKQTWHAKNHETLLQH